MGARQSGRRHVSGGCKPADMRMRLASRFATAIARLDAITSNTCRRLSCRCRLAAIVANWSAVRMVVGVCGAVLPFKACIVLLCVFRDTLQTKVGRGLVRALAPSPRRKRMRRARTLALMKRESGVARFLSSLGRGSDAPLAASRVAGGVRWDGVVVG